MTSDEQAIRDLVSTWMSASQAGDTGTVLSLMTDDIVFLLPGRPPMTKEGFAKASSQAAGEAPKIEGRSHIQEIQVHGDWAFMWTKLEVVVTPPGSTNPIVRSGPTLSILRKVDGKWLLARDANMLTVVEDSGT